MEENFATRLKLFMDHSGLSSSQFADMCGIPRPSLSQVLNGRNKKISDSLVKLIHDAFPDLSVLWLMFGEGPVKVSAGAPAGAAGGGNSASNGATLGAQDRKSENTTIQNPGNAGVCADLGNNSALTGLGNGNSDANISKNQIFESDLKILDLQRQIENMRQNPRKVIQITIYYDDSTFETFVPKG